MHTREAEEQVRCDVEDELQKYRANTHQQAKKTRTGVDNIATRLDQLTTQLNEYRPAQEVIEVIVAAQGEKLSTNVEMRLQLQSSRLENFAESLHKAREEQHSTADTLQTILVSLENLSQNFRRLQEEQLQWSNPEQQMEDEELGREDQAVLDNLLKEVPLTQSHASETIPVSAVSSAQISMTLSEPSFVQIAPTLYLNADGERIQSPVLPMNAPIQSMAQPSFGGFKFQGNFSSTSSPEFNVGAIPSSSYPGLDGHPKRITPIPVVTSEFVSATPTEKAEG